MHIALDGRPLTKEIRGVGIYTNGLVQHLPSLAPRYQYTLFTDAPLSVKVPAAWTVRLIPAWSRTWWETVQLPQAIRREGIDLFHGTDHFQVPMHHACPMVITVHDMTAWLFPETVSWKFHWLFRVRLRRAVAIADHVICVSHSTEHDLHRLLPTSIGKTSVTHEGVSDIFRPSFFEQSAIRNSQFAISKGIHPPYLLSVSALEPRKNLDTLIKAFSLLQQEKKFREYQLVLVGQPWRKAERLYRLSQSNSNIIFTGHVSPGGLVNLYQGAEIFVYPSWYEGFGLPPLESMACGTPVITSNTSCFPEVLGNAAILVDNPRQPLSWVRAILQVLQHPNQQAALRQQGYNRAAQFSWTKMTRNTLHIYDMIGTQK